MFYTVIIPPNNAYISLLNLKREIYKKSRLLSSWALIPQIPLQLEVDESKIVQKKDFSFVPPSGLDLIELKIVKDQCVLTSKILTDYIASLKNSNLGIYGLHLFDISETGAKKCFKTTENLLQTLEKPACCWKSMLVKTYQTDCYLFSGKDWWKKLFLEEINSFGIKMR